MRMQVIITGHVQGVGFRSFVYAKARGLGLVGWVRNRDDGAVEAVFEGTESALQQMLSYARRGPAAAHVVDVRTDWSESTGERDNFIVT